MTALTTAGLTGAAVFLGGTATVAFAAVLRKACRISTRRRAGSRLARCAPEDTALISEAIARSLQSGKTLRQAIDAAARAVASPVSDLLQGALAEAAAGLSISRAVQRMVIRYPLAELRLFAAAVEVASGEVGARAALFDRVATTVRSRTAVRAEAVAQAAQARASAIVVGALPWCAALAVAVQGGQIARVLFGTPLGWASLVVAIAAETLGVWWMLFLARRVVR